MDRPLILVSNDDGISAPGIRALIDVVREIGDVVVVAPDIISLVGVDHTVPQKVSSVGSLSLLWVVIQAFGCALSDL